MALACDLGDRGVRGAVMMHSVYSRVVGTWILGCAIIAIPALQDPYICAQVPPPKKAPDYSGYVTVGEVVGEVVKADDKQVTIQVTWYVPQVSGGGGARRPPIGRGGIYRNPYAPNNNRPRNPPRVNYKEQKHEYDFRMVPESLIRIKTLPPKYDENGKRVAYTSKDLDELRGPPGAPGYAASLYELAPGTIVEVVAMRDRKVPAAKVTEDDLCVKYVIILGSNRLTPNLPPEKETKKEKKRKEKD
jgi:hypothetical protein